jgi:hypothetical protein
MSTNDRGSALLVAIFVLVLLTAMGVTLLALTQNEVRTSRVDRHSKQAFYLSEAGLEAGRQRLYNIHGSVPQIDPFSDDLDNTAGANDTVDLDPDNISPTFDSSGTLTGFTGVGDDAPVLGPVPFADGWYAVFVTNDPVEGITDQDDDDRRVMLTAVGVGRDRSFEITQGLIEPRRPFPNVFPATITLLGPTPSFGDANSEKKVFSGDDCGGAGDPNLSVPVVGTIGADAEANAELGINPNPTYTSGTESGAAVISDLTDPSDPSVSGSLFGEIDDAWTDCELLAEMIEDIRGAADVICQEGVACAFPPSSPDRIVFAHGDLAIGGSSSGEGLIVVTGTFTFGGNASWSGIILVIGEGRFVRAGGGNGTIYGATLVADIAGPDNIYGTADDCTGGTDGLDSVVYDESGGGTSDTTFCSTDIAAATPVTHYPLLDFRQR